MKYILYLILLMPLSVVAQRLTVKSMNDNLVDECVKVADYYVSERISDSSLYRNDKVVSALKTKSAYEYFVPVFFLKMPEANPRPLPEIPLIELIDRTPSPYMQEVFIKEKEYIVYIVKGINDAVQVYNEQKKGSAPRSLLDVYIYSYASDRKEKKIVNRLKRYLALNPDVEVFSIYNLQELNSRDNYWGIRDGCLIKLVLDGNKIKEVDGEEYYRKNFGDIKGVERVINFDLYEELIIM
ncbi:MAG: hypothetical protein PUB21_04735 [Bacteroidales bacterium]|nr:hypothetical protein [Bacteroidales bacterium]